jgi:hypothetical protein
VHTLFGPLLLPPPWCLLFCLFSLCCSLCLTFLEVAEGWAGPSPPPRDLANNQILN